MQIDEQNGMRTQLETAAKAQSSDSKPSRGGKRPGAGRKPNLAKRLLKGVNRDTLVHAVADVDVGAIVVGLLRSKRELTRLETLHFIFDRIQGKPRQDLTLAGGIVHAHTRDPFLASLPKEGLEQLAHTYDEVLAKFLPAPQDGPHNQIESKPAIDAVVVESGGANAQE